MGDQEAGEQTAQEHKPDDAENPIPMLNECDLFRRPLLYVSAGRHSVHVRLFHLAVASHSVYAAKRALDDTQWIVPDFFVSLRNPLLRRAASAHQFISRLATHHRFQAQ